MNPKTQQVIEGLEREKGSSPPQLFFTGAQAFGEAPQGSSARDVVERRHAFLEDELPPGAVPDLSVDGTIELMRLNDVLYMGRPVFGQPNSLVTLFKIDPDGKEANRVQVKLGASSVNSIQILEGLKPGDRVILSDMSAQDQHNRIRLN